MSASSRVRSTGALLLALALTACATSAVTLKPVFERPVTAGPRVEPAPCTLRVLRIDDERLDPGVLGQMGPREVLAPADRQRWLRSVIAGLEPSGVKVEFGSQPQGPGMDIDARVTLQSAWVSALPDAKNSSVVFAVQYLSHGVTIKSADYRGSASEVNWANGSEEIQDLVDEVIQQALAQMAGDFRRLCTSSGNAGARPVSPASASCGRRGRPRSRSNAGRGFS